MKIHHLNCGTLHAPFVHIDSLVYCLLVESGRRLVLVDTGFGLRDYTQPTPKMRFFLNYMGVPRDPAETALHQVRALGYQADDVTDIICTHLHIDHAGGLSDFPRANVHIYEKEYQAAQKPRGMMGFAYLPSQWAHGPYWVFHEQRDTTWFGLDAIQVLTTPETSFYLLPLPGHTPGHCGAAIGSTGNWLLHCGDAASPFHPLTDLHDRGPDAYRLAFFPRKITEGLAGPHASRLKALLTEHAGEIRGISSHDIYSFKEYHRAH